MLFIRTDGNHQIGTGHVMRCLSIADAFKKQGGEVTFIVADNNMEPIIRTRGHDLICLHSDWDNLAHESEKMISLIKTQSIKTLIIDSYFVSEPYLKALCDYTYVIYLDDLNAFHYPCHVLINYSCYADKFNYHDKYPDIELLLGCKYTPLREEFLDLPRRILRRNVKSVLITTGGMDPYNTAGKLITRVKKNLILEHLEFHIVAGQFNPYIDELNRIQAELNGIYVHTEVKSMSSLMIDCDIAVSAGGSTMYELCACGTPTVAFSFADNQLYGVECFGNGFMISAGDIREDESRCLDRIIEGIIKLVSDFELRLEYTKRAQDLVDGKGALRIAELLHMK